MTVLRNKIALALSEPFTADESRKAGKDRSGSQYVLADRVLALLVDDSADRAGALFAELTAVREELKAVKGNRLVSAIFAMPQGQPHPKVFALYRTGDGQVAMGVQFPDQAIVLRWASNDEHPGTTVINERPTGTVEHLLGDDRTQVVWLSEELEPLAQQEKQTEAICAVYEALRQELCSKCRAGFCSAHQPAQGILEALGGGEADPKPATTTTDPTRKDPDDHP